MQYRGIRQPIIIFSVMFVAAGCTNASPFLTTVNPQRPVNSKTEKPMATSTTPDSIPANSIPTTTPVPNTDATATPSAFPTGWSTFESSALRFSIGYPLGFKVQIDSENTGTSTFTMNVVDQLGIPYLVIQAWTEAYIKANQSIFSIQNIFVRTNTPDNQPRTVAGLHGREIWMPVPPTNPAPLEDPDDWYYTNSSGIVWHLSLDPVAEGHIAQNQVSTDGTPVLNTQIYNQIRDSFRVSIP